MDPKLVRLISNRIALGLGDDFDSENADHVTTAFRAASSEGLISWLFWYGQNHQWTVPDNLESWWSDHVARILLYRTITAELPFSMPYVVLKGEPLGTLLFDDSFRRTVTDLDVLVAPKDVLDAVDELHTIGFHIADGHSIRPWAYNQVALRHEDHGAVLELHWRLAMPNLPAPDTATVLATRVCDAGGPPTMNAAYTHIHLAHHLFQHHGFSKGLFDFAAHTLKIDTHDVRIARAIARNIGNETIVDGAHEALHREGFSSHKTANRRAKALAKTYDRTSGFLRTYEQQDTLSAFTETIAAGRFLDSRVDRARASVKPIVFGPHRVGTFLGEKIGREWWE